jgi:hypothetical protein
VFGHNWEPADGKVVNVRSERFGPGDNSPIVRYYLVDIQPGTGEPFRTEGHEPLMTSGSFIGPTEGDVVNLECDPKRQTARFHGDPGKQIDHVAALRAEGERLEAQERRESGERGLSADESLSRRSRRQPGAPANSARTSAKWFRTSELYCGSSGGPAFR